MLTSGFLSFSATTSGPSSPGRSRLCANRRPRSPSRSRLSSPRPTRPRRPRRRPQGRRAPSSRATSTRSGPRSSAYRRRWRASRAARSARPARASSRACCASSPTSIWPRRVPAADPVSFHVPLHLTFCRKNKDRPLDCWKETEQFKAAVARLEQVRRSVCDFDLDSRPNQASLDVHDSFLRTLSSRSPKVFEEDWRRRARLPGRGGGGLDLHCVAPGAGSCRGRRRRLVSRDPAGR
jgi:hypothetical protein